MLNLLIIYSFFSEQLKANELKGQYYLELNFDDIDAQNEYLSDMLRHRSLEAIPLVIITGAN